MKKSLDERFEEAVALALEIPQSDLPQDVQLRCYAYYKQATSERANTSYSDNSDLRNAFKTNAWMQISHLTVDEAKEMYIQTILSLPKG
jgi:acyl-CoA-binding protein